MITQFSGTYDFLSNFYPSIIIYNRIYFPTVEHAYQAAKTFHRYEKIHIAALPTPGQAKRYGQTIKIRTDWDQVKLWYMNKFVEQKFRDVTLRQLLLGTKGERLIEGNVWGDKFWGMVLDKDGYWIGENNLGKILMRIRDEF